MRRFAFSFVILLLEVVSLQLLAATGSVRTEATESGVVITISKVAASVQQQLLTLRSDEESNRKFGLPSISSENYAKRFFVIVPASATVRARFLHTSVRPLVGVIQDKLPFSQRDLYVRPAGISSGQHIAEIVVQPLDSRGIGLTASVLDSAVIAVEFIGGTLHAHDDTEVCEHAGLRVLNDKFCSLEKHRPPTIGSNASISVPLSRAGLTRSRSGIQGDGKILRVASTRDGVAQIDAKLVLGICPEWRGVTLSSLRLRFKNVEQYLYVPPQDNFFNDSSEVYFFGRRAAGDTTWLSPFSRECVMYLNVDSTSAALRYRERVPVADVPILTTISIDKHIEEERDYNQSYFYDDPFNSFFVTETVPGEKWHWASFDRRTPFITDIPLVASTSSSDSIHVGILYNAVNNIRDAKPDKRVQWFLNGGLLYDETFDSTAERYVTASLGGNESFGGVMSCKIVSLGANTTVPNYSEKQILDYITIRGTTQSYAFNGSLEGRTSHPAASMLRVRRLSSARSVLLDTANNEALVVRAVPGVSFVAGTRSGSVYSTSIVRNDSVIFFNSDQSSAVHCFVPPEYTAGPKWQGSSSSGELASFLQAIPSNSIVVLTANDADDFSADVRAWLQKQGCTSVADRGTKGCFGVILQKDNRVFDERAGDSTLTIAHFVSTQNGVSFEANVPLRAGENSVTITSADKIETAHIQDAGSDSYLNDSTEAEYVIVTHIEFVAEAERLAEYRRRQGVSAKVVDVEDIYRDFGDGQKSPHAIKNFLRFAYNSWRGKQLRHVLLFGDASWDARQLPPFGLKRDFVPTYGKPVSDIWYSLIDGDDVLPDVNVGRLPVESRAQAKMIVDKVIAYDTLKPAEWWKHFVFVSGGDGAAEQEDFRDISLFTLVPFVVSDDPDVKPYTICGDTTILTTRTIGLNPTYSLSAELNRSINNEGAVWVNYIGHGAPTITEISGWDTTTVKNYDRPFVLSTLACQNAAFAERDVSCIDEDFLNAQSRGAVAACGSTGYGVPLVQQRVMQDMFAEMGRGKNRTLGEIFTRAEALLSRYPGNIYQGVFFQCCLLGDPLTRVPFDTVIRPVVIEKSLTVKDELGNNYITEDKDSSYARFLLFNAGVSSDDSIPIAMIHRYDATVDTVWSFVRDVCNTSDVVVTVYTKDQPGDHTIRIEIDPFNSLRRIVVRDSSVQRTFRVYSPQALPIEPLPRWDVSALQPVFRWTFSAPERLNDLVQLRVRMDDSVVVSRDFGDERNVRRTPTHIEWQPDVRLPDGRELQFDVRSVRRESSDTSAWLVVPFHVQDSITSVVKIRSTVQRDAASYQADGFRLDSSTTPHELVMNRLIPFHLQATVGRLYYDSSGVLRFDIVQGYQIRINNVSYGDNMFQRGINVRTVNRFTGEVNAVRTFDTFFDVDTCDMCFNGSGRTLNRFLRTSVSDSEYVLMANCGPSYGDVFVRRDLDTLRAILNAFGSKQSHLLQDPRSFVFLGSKDTVSVRAQEVVNTDTSGLYTECDTVSLSGELRISPMIGRITSPLLGPAKRWRSLSFEGTVNDSIAQTQLIVLGYHTPYSTPDTLFTRQGFSTTLDSVNSDEYPYVRGIVTCVRSRIQSDVSIRSVVAEMDPLPEFAVIPGSAKAIPDSVLRGDTVVTSAVFQRISTRGVADSITSELRVISLEGSGEDRTLRFSAAKPASDADIVVADTSTTLRYSTRSMCRFLIDPANVFPELYRFNNSSESEQQVVNDEWSPEVIVYIDSVLAFESMPVPQKPRVQVVMMDNSGMPITQSANLSARVNLVPIDTTAVAGYRFWGSNDVQSAPWTTADARAVIDFTPELEFGSNTIRIRARDYFGNETIRTVGVRVNRDISADSVTVSPNPFSESATIHFELRSPVLSQTVQLQIYDVRGNLVRDIRRPARIGRNSITIDDRDNNGALLLQGSYYYRLFIGDEVNLDMRTGVILLLR